ncbi:MAG: acyl-CoA dehydrogenase [Lautropia sp.]
MAADLQAFGNSARDFLARHGGPARVRAQRVPEQAPRRGGATETGGPDAQAAAAGFDRAVWAAVCDAGWPAVLVPEQAGGLGLRADHAAAIAQEVGRALLPEPFIGAGVLAPCLLSRLPAHAQRDRLLAGVLSGECIAGVAWQDRESAAGAVTDTAACETQAQAADRRFTLHGRKRWVSPGPGADGWVVTARLPDGTIALLWLPANATGLRLEVQPRIDGSAMAMLHLNGVELPANALLADGAQAQQALAYALDMARLMQAAELLGIARRAFADTLDYLKTRVQFGKPIGANQALQHRMVDGYLQLELAEAALAEMLSLIACEPDALALAASRCKARCADTALQVTRLAIQLHGAMGYTDECDIGLYAKRAMQLAAWLGHARAHRMRWLRLARGRAQAAAAVPSAQPPQAADAAPAPAVFPRDADWAAMDDASFRALVRGFFRTHYPPALRDVPRRLHWPEIRDWYMTLSRQGWLAPSWPREWGGMALPPDKLLAFIEEQEAHGVARMPDQGLINLGPLLIGFGTEAQKRRWLPPIIAGEHIWCQGYSEPGAGSDLAALRTEAVADGDDFIVNGQKIWTTLAMDATHIFLLVRTGRFAKKQEGISFLLADLSSPGVTVRPIPNIAGEEEFCEVFFDNVRVPRCNLVGELHRGWHLAKALLGHERIFVGSPKAPQYALGRLRAAGEALGLADEPAFADRQAQLEIDVADLRALYARFADIVKRGGELPPSVSLLKIWATETYTRIGAALMEASAEHGGAQGVVEIQGEAMAPLQPLMNAMVTTIYGGTNEIQRNIVARQVLGLPS